MDLLKDDVKGLYLKFLIPAISSAIVVAAYCEVRRKVRTMKKRD